ncbi:hypothetical protein JXA40_05170 [bacterium]|nr:hypothetical protein [candidate division CSSED10-310 bacterium]
MRFSFAAAVFALFMLVPAAVHPDSDPASGLADIELADTLMRSRSVPDWLAAKSKYDRVLELFSDGDIIDPALVGRAGYFFQTQQYTQAEVDLCRVLLRRANGDICLNALQLYTNLKVAQSRINEAFMSLQRIKLHPGPDEKFSHIDNRIDLLARLYIFKTDPLRINRSFNADTTALESLDMFCIPLHSNSLYAADRKGMLVEIHPESGRTIRKTAIVPGIRNINQGQDSELLFAGDTTIGTETAPIRFRGYEFKKIVDAVWTTPGEYWVLDRNAKGILQFDAEGMFRDLKKGFSFKGDEVFCASPHGGTWLLIPVQQKILFFNYTGEMTREMGFQTSGYTMLHPVDMAVDGFGHLYVLDSEAEAVYVFNTALTNIATFSLAQIGLKTSNSSQIAIGNDGGFYLGDRKAKTIYRLD